MHPTVKSTWNDVLAVQNKMVFCIKMDCMSNDLMTWAQDANAFSQGMLVFLLCLEMIKKQDFVFVAVKI